mmetsp:Transcript_82076/g.232417  ORF Transcript_82076/g.232417 Transcript_82076/m.232417 type:complete len:212 (-) Transcript_82076:2722-3357(-)
MPAPLMAPALPCMPADGLPDGVDLRAPAARSNTPSSSLPSSPAVAGWLGDKYPLRSAFGGGSEAPSVAGWSREAVVAAPGLSSSSLESSPNMARIAARLATAGTGASTPPCPSTASNEGPAGPVTALAGRRMPSSLLSSSSPTPIIAPCTVVAETGASSAVPASLSAPPTPSSSPAELGSEWSVFKPSSLSIAGSLDSSPPPRLIVPTPAL